MMTKRLFTLSMLAPFMAISTMVYAGATHQNHPSRDVAQVTDYRTPGWAMEANERYDNNIVHRYHGGPKYPQ